MRGLLGIEHNINNYTDKHYLAVLRQEEKKEQKTVQLVPFELPHNTIKPQEHGAEDGKKRQ